MLCAIFSSLLAASFQFRLLCGFHKFIVIMFHNVNWGNLEKVLQRTGNVRECIFRASGGTNIENLPGQNQPWWDFRKIKHPDIRHFVKKCVVFEKKTSQNQKCKKQHPIRLDSSSTRPSAFSKWQFIKNNLVQFLSF